MTGNFKQRVNSDLSGSFAFETLLPVQFPGGLNATKIRFPGRRSDRGIHETPPLHWRDKKL
jgi:hypothetical protein